MFMRIRAAVGAVVVVIALGLVALAGLVSHQAPVSNPTASGNGAVVFVGALSGLAGETLVFLKSRYPGPSLEVTEIAGLPNAATKVDYSSIVVFNSDWLVGKVGDVALTNFFKTILPTEVKVVALGGHTSLLFDAIKQARDGIFADGRNPAFNDPPLAGYKLKHVTGPDGTPLYGDSILIGRPGSAPEAADSIVNWG